MKMKTDKEINRNLVSLCLMTVVLSGCSTMHFTQNVSTQRSSQNNNPEDVKSHWHNTTLNGMVEISHPVNLYKECEGQPWQQVTVEFGPLTGLTTIAVNAAMDAIIPALTFVNFYAPWNVDTQCSPVQESI